MKAHGGEDLLQGEAREIFSQLLLPRATVLTPNLPEAEVLLDRTISLPEEIREAARELQRMGADNVVIKGGHARKDQSPLLPGAHTAMESGDLCVDLLFNGRDFFQFASPWVDTLNDHGTGCTFASAVAALLARGKEIEAAVRGAKDYVYAALRSAAHWQLGQGHGPLNHFPRPMPDSVC